MLQPYKMRTFTLAVCSLLIAVSVTGCSSIPALNPATESPTQIPATNTIVPSATPELPTNTPEPTPTSAPSATALPALAVVPDGINPWCLPITFGSHVDGPNGPASMPEGGRAGTVNKKTGVVNFHIPAVTCTLVLRFNRAVPAGMSLQVWDASPQEPFVVYEFNPNPGNPNEAYAIMNHTYIINPPKWWMDYTIVVVTPDGKEVFRAPAHFFKSLPEKCWDDSLPDPITLFCPIQDS